MRHYVRAWKPRESRALRFLLVGGASFAIDFGLLVLLHEAFGIVLWIATPCAFVASLVFNFAAQRTFTFAATNSVGSGAGKYAALVVFNVVASAVIVTGFDYLGLGYAAGKVTATVLMTVWNFVLYKYWVFPGTSVPDSSSPSPVTVSAGPGRRSQR